MSQCFSGDKVTQGGMPGRLGDKGVAVPQGEIGLIGHLGDAYKTLMCSTLPIKQCEGICYNLLNTK